jgi:Spy/CpxP family protein refolding chaperone
MVNSWKVILATVVIFGAGVLTGGLLVNYVNHPHFKGTPPAMVANQDRGPQRPPEFPMPHLADRMGRQFVQQLDEKLQLTPEQHGKIVKIIADGQERNHAIWTNIAPQMRRVMQEVNQQIRATLTPEQQKQFEQLLKQFRPAGHHPPLPPTNAPPAGPPPGV